jgi:hypothetical protein
MEEPGFKHFSDVNNVAKIVNWLCLYLFIYLFYLHICSYHYDFFPDNVCLNCFLRTFCSHGQETQAKTTNKVNI